MQFVKAVRYMPGREASSITQKFSGGSHLTVAEVRELDSLIGGDEDTQ